MGLFVNKSKQYTKNEVENYSMQPQNGSVQIWGKLWIKLTKYMKIFELSYKWKAERDGNPDSFQGDGMIAFSQLELGLAIH